MKWIATFSFSSSSYSSSTNTTSSSSSSFSSNSHRTLIVLFNIKRKRTIKAVLLIGKCHYYDKIFSSSMPFCLFMY